MMGNVGPRGDVNEEKGENKRSEAAYEVAKVNGKLSRRQGYRCLRSETDP